MALCLGGVGPGDALAHPFAARVTAHQLRVTVTTSAVHLDYTVETPAVGSTERAGTLDLQSLDELAAGFVLTYDDSPLAVSPDPATPPRSRGGSHTVVMRVGLVAPLPSTRAGTLRVENGNYPDLPGYFATEVRVAPRVQVLASSQFLTRRDGALADRGGAWEPGDAGRVLTLDLRRRDGWIARAYERLTGASGTTRSAWSSRPRALPTTFFTGGMSAALAALVLAAGAALALTHPPRTRGHALAWLAALALPALLHLALPPTTLPWVQIALGCLAVGAARWPAAAAPAALAACGAALGYPGLTAALAALVAVAALAVRPRPDANAPPGWRHAIFPLVIGSLVLLRGLGAIRWGL